jgi:hypothetical protein
MNSWEPLMHTFISFLSKDFEFLRSPPKSCLDYTDVFLHSEFPEKIICLSPKGSEAGALNASWWAPGEVTGCWGFWPNQGIHLRWGLVGDGRSLGASLGVYLSLATSWIPLSASCLPWGEQVPFLTFLPPWCSASLWAQKHGAKWPWPEPSEMWARLNHSFQLFIQVFWSQLQESDPPINQRKNSISRQFCVQDSGL